MNSIRFKEIQSYVKQNYEKFISMRRHLHQHPELGRQEYETSKYLRHNLEEIGYNKVEMVGPTGFVTDLITDMKSHWVALRGDMDALPIVDLKKVPYKSLNEGVCHACGHDFHSTVVFGVAQTLKYFVKHLRGNVRFIFQHAEEPIPGGALDFVKSGKLDKIRAVFGLHADPELPVGHIGLRSGWINAQSNRIKFKISGPGGHSSRPHQVPDPVYVGTIMLNLLYSSLSRLQNPEKPFIFSIGKINSGTSYNSIASTFEAEGTLRVTDVDYGDHVIKNITDNVKKITSLFNVSAKLEVTRGAPPVVNDANLTMRVKKILESAKVSETIVEHQRSFGGEDFSSLLSKAPGVFLRFGVNNNHFKANLHTGNFDIDEAAVPFSIISYTWIMMNMLKHLQHTN